MVQASKNQRHACILRMCHADISGAEETICRSHVVSAEYCTIMNELCSNSEQIARLVTFFWPFLL
jgi:hypothetical protein